MAGYGLKYLCEYRSKMRGRLLYRIEIEERDAAARTDDTALRMRPYSDVFSLKWGSSDDPEYTAVKGSSLTLKILCVDDMEYLSLFSVDPLKYRITIYEYRTDVSGQDRKLMLWRGFLSAGSYKEAFARPPYVVTLSATDGLSLLDTMPFQTSDGSRYTGLVSLEKLYTDLFQWLGSEMRVVEWTGIAEPPSAESVPSFLDICIDADRIYEYQNSPTWQDVLEICTKPFNAQVFQARGVFHIRRIVSLLYPDRPVGFDPYGDVLGLSRPVVHAMWQDGCDVNSSTELGLLPPYKYAQVTLANSDELSEETFYAAGRWSIGNAVSEARSRIMRDRIFLVGVNPVADGVVARMSPMENTNINISLELFNAKSYVQYAYVGVRAVSGEAVRYWNVSTGMWETVHSDGASMKKEIARSDVGDVNEFYPLNNLSSQTFQFNITSVPKMGDTSNEMVDIHVVILINEYSGYRSKTFIANISFNSESGSVPVDYSMVKLPITRSNVDKCEWEIPIRDGGYCVNAMSFMSNVLMAPDGSSITGWISPTEQGSLMGIATADVQYLRSRIARQLYGELRCPEGVDLNSLFLDGKYTEALYYVNSLELYAHRQVYKVQLRELADLRLQLPAYEWVTVGRFAAYEEIAASLCGALFMRYMLSAEQGIYGVRIYNTFTREASDLPYSGTQVDVRKGYNAVVIYTGGSEVYAVDNVGDAVSIMRSEVSSILKMDTALYDANRKIWVSYDVETVIGKTVVSVLSDNLELLSQDEFEVQATGMFLMANGYVLINGTAGTSYWHGYDMHSSNELLGVNDPYDPTSDSQWLMAAVSDKIIVRFISEDYLLQVAVRYGLKMNATIWSTGEFPSNVNVAMVACNNQVIALTGQRDGVPSELWAYNVRTRKAFSLNVPCVAGCGVSGSCAYFLTCDQAGPVRELKCIQLEQNCLTDRYFYLLIDGVAGDVVYDDIATVGDRYDIRVQTDGTPYIVSRDERLQVSISGNGPAYILTISIPRNESHSQVAYDPVVVGIRENFALLRKVFCMQHGVMNYYLKLNNSDGNYSTTVMAQTTFFAVPLETNGTVVVKHEGIDYIHPEVAPDKRSITFTVSENTSPKERVCSILVTLEEDPTVQRYVVVTQKGAVQVPYYLTIDGSTEDYVASVDSGAGMLSVPVQTNGTVEVLTNGASFLTPSVSENNTSISIAVASNAGEARNGTLTVRLVEDPSIVRYITVKQEAVSESYYLKVRGTTFNTGITDIPADGADYSLKVETNGTPYIVSKDDRIEASLSGDGSTVYYIAVTIPKNASTSPVNYEDLVTGIREDDSLRRKTSFKQSGAAQADYYLTINGSTDDYYVDVDAGAHELTVPIQTNGTATVFAQGSPFVSPVVSDDNASVTITVDPNDGGVSRNGTIRVSIAENPDLERFIVVRQSNVSSYYLKINGQDSDAAYRDVPAEGAEYHPSIETNGTPRIVSKDNRLEAVFRQEASGVSGIDIVVPENDMADPVTYENIVIDLEEDNAVRRAISVSQLAAPYYLRLNGSEDRYETTVSSAAQSFTLPVETNGTPKVMPLPLEYIRIELSADGRSVTFTLDENTASEDRVIQALITLEEDSSVQRYVTITQQKAEPPVEITFSNLTSLKLYFKNPDITSAYGTVDAGSDVRIVPEGDIGFYQMSTPSIILKIVSVVSGVECGHWESAAPRRYVFEYDLFKREVYDKTGETEVMIKSGF